MNWGKGIALVLFAFMLMISVLVYKSTQQDFSLVSTNYYEDAIEHDKTQQERSNYAQLNAAVSVKNIKEKSAIQIELPAQFNDTKVEGEVHFYNPVNDKMDQRFALNNTVIEIGKNQLQSGRWKIKVKWHADGKNYLFEKTQFIN